MVNPSPRPAGDVVTQGKPEEQGGVWHQTWITRDYTEEERAEQLGQAKKQAFQRINDGYNAAVASLVRTYPEREEATFTKQEAEAVAWAADNTTPTPFLDGLMRARDIEKDVLVSRILEKAAALADATGEMTGKRQALESAVEAVTIDNYANAREAIDAANAIQW